MWNITESFNIEYIIALFIYSIYYGINRHQTIGYSRNSIYKKRNREYVIHLTLEFEKKEGQKHSTV